MELDKSTLFIDIDGTILYHHGSIEKIIECKPIVLPHVVEKLSQWKKEGHLIVLTTARGEEIRYMTECHLKECKIPYDMLIMGVTRGIRYVINDTKNSYIGETCKAITVERNGGFRNIVL